MKIKFTLRKLSVAFSFIMILFFKTESRAQLGCYAGINPANSLWNNIDSVYACDGVTYASDTEAVFQNGIGHYTFDPAIGNPNGCHADFTYDFINHVFVDSSVTLNTPLYFWEFSDYNDFSTLSSPHHVWVTTGFELVCLTLTDGACISKT